MKSLKQKISLFDYNKKLAGEWHPDKNGSLTPKDVTSNSGKKVWWKCKNGHEWQATISNRNNGRNCPYCSGKKVNSENSLATINPNLSKEWNYKKNNELNPYLITAGSNKKVWWICLKGHEWQATISQRHNGSGCPYCSGKKVCDENSLLVLNPLLSKEWNYKRNGSLTPKEVTSKSGKKVWWICENGHEWKADIYNRSKDIGCPYCSGRNATLKSCLATINPFLSKEWNYKRNTNLTPNVVTSKSGKKVWWLCINGHEWKAAISDRANGNGCPYCSKEMKSSFPEQVIYYYLKKQFQDAVSSYKFILENKKYEIDIYIPSLSLGIEYDGAIYHNNLNRINNDELKNKILNENNIKLLRIRETGCPNIDMHGQEYIPCENSKTKSSDIFLSNSIKMLIYYINNHYNMNFIVDVDINRDRSNIYEQYIHLKKANSLEELNPELSKEWNYEKNKKLTPDKVTVSSGKKVWWLCKNNHEWQATIASRNNNGNNCPYCSGRLPTPDNNLKTNNSILAEEWNFEKNSPLLPVDVTISSGKRVWWRCEKGHEWQATINSRSAGRGCPVCSNKVILKENSLSSLYPNLEKEWNYRKNDDLNPIDVSPGSSKKVWWICQKGHEWQAIISDRSNGNNCPYCHGRYATIENNFANKYPELSKEWNYKKNDGLLPTDVTPKSHKRVWWICENGHEWEATVAHRSNGTGCPLCWKNQK